MDFVGQKLADRLHQIITALFGVVGFAYGYYHQRFAFTMYISMLGLLTSAVLCVPDWGCLNQNPLDWQTSGEELQDEDEEEEEETLASKAGSKSATETKKSDSNKKSKNRGKNKSSKLRKRK
mmetsp:Transcript_14176/g.21531  ORF Transcript_14176/g.21531 Transcript_14176/m.21531 type:complete len:122 (-) Transcript_14176:98-463(-)